MIPGHYRRSIRVLECLDISMLFQCFAKSNMHFHCPEGGRYGSPLPNWHLTLDHKSEHGIPPCYVMGCLIECWYA